MRSSSNDNDDNKQQRLVASSMDRRDVLRASASMLGAVAPLVVFGLGLGQGGVKPAVAAVRRGMGV